jgi:hypothetical protein
LSEKLVGQKFDWSPTSFLLNGASTVEV